MGFNEQNATGITDQSGGLREMATLAAPLVLSQILITAMGVVDSVVVGRLGASELAAVGLAGIWVWALSAFFVGAATSVQTFVAQHHGANESEQCGSWCWQGLISVVPCAALAGLLIFLGAHEIIQVLDPSDDVKPLARGYMRARSLGVGGLAIAVTLSSFFRGIGDARTPFVATLFANLLNLFLDFGLVYGWFGFPKLGVVGAGVATTISEWAYAGIVAWFFGRAALVQAFGTRRARPDWQAIRRLWRVGLPIAGQWVTGMAALALFTTFVARMGYAQMAASHAFVQLMSLSFMQAEGISLAAATLVGRYIGAARLDLAERSYRSSLVLATLLTAIVAALFIIFPEQLIGLFADDPAVLAFAGPLLILGAIYQYCDAMAIVTDGALRGAGDTTWPFIARGSLAWFITLPLSYALAFPLGGGLTGAWCGGLVSMTILAALLVWRLRSGAWQRIRI